VASITGQIIIMLSGDCHQDTPEPHFIAGVRATARVAPSGLLIDRAWVVWGYRLCMLRQTSSEAGRHARKSAPRCRFPAEHSQDRRPSRSDSVGSVNNARENGLTSDVCTPARPRPSALSHSLLWHSRGAAATDPITFVLARLADLGYDAEQCRRPTPGRRPAPASPVG
jgi:hypothetical protein